MVEFASTHPILFAILAFPVVITGCVIALELFGIKFRRE